MAAAVAPKQFTMQTLSTAVIQGGYTNKDIHLRIEFVDGYSFVQLRQQHQWKLFAAWGCAGKEHAAQTRQLFDYLKEARTKEVDALLRAALRSDDPMADVDAVVDDLANRKALFLKHDITKMCVVKVGQFKLTGEMHPAFDLKVLTAVNKVAALNVECTCEVFDWLCKALHADEAVWLTPAAAAPRIKRKLEDMPEVPFPIKYGQLKNGRICIWANYKRATGKWSRHQKTIDETIANLSDGTESGNVDAMASICESFSRQLAKKQNGIEDDEGDEDDEDHHEEQDEEQEEELAEEHDPAADVASDDA